MQSDPNNDSTSEGDSTNTLDVAAKAGSKSAPKRRASRAGTRSVATLSEAQLARKRANDREAQRLIRQRTKDHIEHLEKRIQELSSGKGDHQELEKLRRRNSELEQELRFLKDSRAMSDGSPPASDFAQGLDKGKRISLTRTPSAPTSYPNSYNPGDDSGATSPLSMHDASWPPQTNSTYSAISFSGPVPQSGSTADKDSFGNMSRYGAYEDSAVMGIGAATMDPVLTDSSERSWGETSSRNRIHTPVQNTGLVQLGQPVGQSSLAAPPSVPVWELPIRSIPPTGPIDSIFMSLIHEQRNKALNAASISSIIGPQQPDMSAIAYPEQLNTSHHVSTVISDLLKKTALPRLPERAAALFSIYHLCQWQIHPSEMTYNALFDWQIPQDSQIETPHPIWATYIAWPKLRDEVIRNQVTYGNDDFQHIYTSSLNLNWPWRDVDCFIFEKNSEVHVSEGFERHISSLANWSLDAPFARRYPELGSLCKFTGNSDSSGQYI